MFFEAVGSFFSEAQHAGSLVSGACHSPADGHEKRRQQRIDQHCGDPVPQQREHGGKAVGQKKGHQATQQSKNPTGQREKPPQMQGERTLLFVEHRQYPSEKHEQQGVFSQRSACEKVDEQTETESGAQWKELCLVEAPMVDAHETHRRNHKGSRGADRDCRGQQQHDDAHEHGRAAYKKASDFLGGNSHHGPQSPG